MRNHFEAARQLAAQQPTADYDELAHEAITTATFGSDLDYLDEQSQARVEELMHLREQREWLLGEMNVVLINEALWRISERTGAKLFDSNESVHGLDRDGWLAHRRNTHMLLRPLANNKRERKEQLKYERGFPAWVIGERPRDPGNGRLVFDYIVAMPLDYIKPANQVISIGMVTTRQRIQSTIDPVPTADEVRRSYHPDTHTLSLHYPHTAPAARVISENPDISYGSIPDNQMQEYDVSTHLMRLIKEYGTLDTSDVLLANYAQARDLALELFGDGKPSPAGRNRKIYGKYGVTCTSNPYYQALTQSFNDPDKTW
jgi:hypothetical protein